MFILDKELIFPPPETADPDGLLAIGGDLSPERLILAYKKGIFPWFDTLPILWWSPNPRFVLFPHKLKVSKTMKKLFKAKTFEVTYDRCFEKVIEECASIKRKGQIGTWITPEMKKAYHQLFQMGFVRSVEVWQNNQLVGGLYGVYLKEKQVFCGESMFSKVSNASKYGFISLVEKLKGEGIKLIDCQVSTKHLKSFGAEEISRQSFLEFLSDK